LEPYRELAESAKISNISIYTYVVNEEKEGGSETQRVKGSRQDRTLLQDSKGDSCILPLPDLDDCERGGEDAEENEECYDSGIAPFVLGPAPAQGKQQADDGRKEDSSSVGIKLSDLGFPSLGRGHSLLAWSLEKEDDDENRDGSNWQIDGKAPSPRGVSCKCSSHQWPGHRGNPVLSIVSVFLSSKIGLGPLTIDVIAPVYVGR
jgi:hypothetical protein